MVSFSIPNADSSDADSSLYGVSLYFQDETLTTKEAEERMKKSPRFNFKVDPTQIDSLSASIILEDFLRAHGHDL